MFDNERPRTLHYSKIRLPSFNTPCTFRVGTHIYQNCRDVILILILLNIVGSRLLSFRSYRVYTWLDGLPTLVILCFLFVVIACLQHCTEDKRKEQQTADHAKWNRVTSCQFRGWKLMLTIPFSKASTQNIHDVQKDFGNNYFNSY